MRSLCGLLVVLFTFTAFAQSERKLANGQYAYYGEAFYNTKVSKDSLQKILRSVHSINTGKFDTIGTECTSAVCYSQNSVGYTNARKILFGELFIQKDSRGTFVQDVYCSKKFYFRNIDEVSNMHTEVNIEHTWPQSRFSRYFDKNMQKSDMHHLYPADSDANNKRANHEFGDVGDNADELNVESCSISQLGNISDHFIFTPPTFHRGNVARSLFYFATRYGLTISQPEEMIIRLWDKMDPVDEAEKARHEIVARYQKERNPFVDYPELIEKISDF